MRQFKHKTLGRIAVEVKLPGHSFYWNMGSIPAWVIENSTDWEELVVSNCTLCGREIVPSEKKDCICLKWEIRSFRDKVTGFVIPRLKEGWYGGTNGETSYYGATKSYLQSPDNRYEPCSIRRYHDNAIFRIGDVIASGEDIDKIVGFHLERENCWIKMTDPAFAHPNVLDKKVRELFPVRKTTFFVVGL
ncbi:MAG TPA: hypothetical protein VGM30_10360 [Puia sp.]|jgi:hypothetical protein